TVALAVATPVIVAIAVFKPLVLSTLYSNAFHPAAIYLRWTLIGDYLKVSSWVLSIPLLAAAELRAFLTADVVSLATFVISTWLISFVRGSAESAAIGFLLCYIVHFILCFGYARRCGFRMDRRRQILWICGLALVVVASVIF